MATTIRDILEDIQKHREQIIINSELLQMFEGNLLCFVEKSIRRELNPQAANRACERIAPINVLTKLIEKISKTYSLPVIRKAIKESQQEKLDFIVGENKVDTTMNLLQKLTNLHRYSALEKYIEEGVVKDRIIPADRFHLYAADPMRPMEMTHFIKFIGSTNNEAGQVVNSEGCKIQSAETDFNERTSLFQITTADEIVIINDKGDILSAEDNALGEIPVIVTRQTSFDLVPLANTDLHKMTVLIPKLLTDLNYVVQFQSHSILYGIDVDITNASGNPDAVWMVNSAEGPDKSPSIGTLKPDADIGNVLELIKAEISLWLESKGLKAGTMGSLSVDSAASGISKAIDNVDITELRKEQDVYFKGVEAKYWELTVRMEALAGNGSGITDDLVPTIEFEEPKPFVNKKEMLEEIILKVNNKLTSKKQAIREANAHLDESEIEALIEEIEGEKVTLAFPIQEGKSVESEATSDESEEDKEE